MFNRDQQKASATEKPANGGTSFPTAACQGIALAAPAKLALYGEDKRGYLKVTLNNNTRYTLDPATDPDIVFSFRLLDSKGKIRSLDAARTPLSGPIPPGATHRQRIRIVIPDSEIEPGASVRIGLLREHQYWFEDVAPNHPCPVQIADTLPLDTFDASLAAAAQIWDQGKGNRMRWPYGAMMVSERHKLFYIPVAKCACTSLKSMMVKLAGIDAPEVAIELGIHSVADRFNTGVQLKDKPIELAREILASDEYFKFSVIRHPFERLVSAYLEKFVYERTNASNLSHTEEVIRAVQGSAAIDAERGISFDQFAAYILAQDPYDLDPHWRPQYLYFLGVPHMSQIFRLENISQLQTHLLQSLGVDIQLRHANATKKSDIQLAGASKLSAGELDSRGSIDPESFLSSEYAQALREYYCEDFKLYDNAGR